MQQPSVYVHMRNGKIILKYFNTFKIVNTLPQMCQLKEDVEGIISKQNKYFTK